MEKDDKTEKEQEIGDDVEPVGDNQTPPPTKGITLKEAIELGEYDPEYLSTFPEWHTLPHYVQFQYVKKASEIRERQLMQQWAQVNNFLCFSEKPELAEALKSIEKQRKKFLADIERIFVEFAKKG